MTEKQLLELTGAILDIVALSHKNRKGAVLQRLGRLMELSDDVPAGTRSMAIGWVADRANVSLDQQLPLDLEDQDG